MGKALVKEETRRQSTKILLHLDGRSEIPVGLRYELSRHVKLLTFKLLILFPFSFMFSFPNEVRLKKRG